jgi:tRNA U55 pseudouridine synthase TruB
MAFESIAPYIDQIEQGFLDKKSLRDIANSIGCPGLYRTIARYKTAVWDMKDLVSETKEERAIHHEQRREAAKWKIVESLDLIEKVKSRAYDHLDWMAGDEYEALNEEGQPVKRKASPGQVIAWHHQAADMASKALKAELELSGDDPESRKADTFLELVELANRRSSGNDS